jgi:uncharacterized protein (TIGR03083 family)
VVATGVAVDEERVQLVRTLRAVGPDAPTLAGPWSAVELASHIAAQDRLGGIPAYLARSAATASHLRLSALYRNRPRVAGLVNGRLRPWDVSLRILSAPPPRAVLAPPVAVITLWEHFVHHEDVRRPNGIERRSSPDLEPVLDWILRYNNRRLSKRVRVVTEDRTREAGHGDPLTITGATAEVVLWLSGRAAEVNLEPASAEAEELHRHLAS